MSHVACHMSHVTCLMSNAYVDPWDMLNNFCFHVYAQMSLFMDENVNAFFLTPAPLPVSGTIIELVPSYKKSIAIFTYKQRYFSIEMKTKVVQHVPRINLSHFNFWISNLNFLIFKFSIFFCFPAFVWLSDIFYTDLWGASTQNPAPMICFIW